MGMLLVCIILQSWHKSCPFCIAVMTSQWVWKEQRVHVRVQCYFQNGGRILGMPLNKVVQIGLERCIVLVWNAQKYIALFQHLLLFTQAFLVDASPPTHTHTLLALYWKRVLLGFFNKGCLYSWCVDQMVSWIRHTQGWLRLCYPFKPQLHALPMLHPSYLMGEITLAMSTGKFFVP